MTSSCAQPQAVDGDPLREINVLAEVRSWAAQLQGLEVETSIHRLANAAVDMVVIEPMRSMRDMATFATAEVVRRIHSSPGPTLPSKRCLAYLNIGQAEDYRAYWGADWRAPQDDRPGRPEILLAVDPDGWTGNYQVAFWDSRWRSVLYGSPASLLDQILADGFDGAYLDWILAFEDPAVIAAARRSGVDPATAMVDLLGNLRRYARARHPLFVLVGQNCVGLAERAPRVFEALDGIAQEDLSFRGSAAASWNDADAGDIPAPAAGDWSTARLARRLQLAAERGIPVFTLDYAVRLENVQRAMETSRHSGFSPFVSRTPLDRVPEHVRPLSR